MKILFYLCQAISSYKQSQSKEDNLLSFKKLKGLSTLCDLWDKIGIVATKINISKTQHMWNDSFSIDFVFCFFPTSGNYSKSFYTTDHKRYHPGHKDGEQIQKVFRWARKRNKTPLQMKRAASGTGYDEDD